MRKRPVSLRLCLLVLALPTSLSFAGELRAFEQHVRTEHPQVRALLRHGFDTSPSLRVMIEQLMATDVLVHVEPRRFANPRLEGTLTFVTSAGGRRYLKVQFAADRAPRRQLAAIGHELQHALEVARAPAIVSAMTLAHEYVQIGWEKTPDQGGRRFESSAAIEAGQRVWREYVGVGGR